MSFFGSAIKFILNQDPTAHEILRVKESLDEMKKHKKDEAAWSDEERKMAEEATEWLRVYDK